MSESQPGQPSADLPPDAARPDEEDAQRVAASAFQLSQDPVTEPDADVNGGNSPGGEAPPAPAYEFLGELPATYGTQSVYLVAYDPKQLFAYWDVDWSATPGMAYALHVCRTDGETEAEVVITAADAGRYVPVAVPGGTYFVELGTRGRDGSWNPVAHSGRVTMPPDGLAGEDEPKFATLPFHLSFQRLLELIQGAMGHGENLTAALARLQHGDRAEMHKISGALGGLGSDQMHTLENLLGQRFSVNSVGDTDSRNLLRDRPEALGAGAFGSEGLSSGGLARGAGGSEGLSSAGLIGPVGGMGSENLSSGAFGGDRTLHAFAAGMSSETLSSFMGPRGGGGSEAWRLAGVVGPGGSDLAASERAADFQQAIKHNLDVLGALFSAVNAGLGGGSGGSSPGGGGSDVSSPGRW
ncbi:MAG: DUF4912 domain-containing protein [Gluconacetobacter diazotrophicus]|nr:DUF4912 domain-containing protein [Gluconacetobacter diazotrophicus]